MTRVLSIPGSRSVPTSRQVGARCLSSAASAPVSQCSEVAVNCHAKAMALLRVELHSHDVSLCKRGGKGSAMHRGSHDVGWILTNDMIGVNKIESRIFRQILKKGTRADE